MKRILIIMLVSVLLHACGSGEDSTDTSLNISSTEIVSVSGGEIPLEADLVMFWVVPSDEFFDSDRVFISGGGSLSNGLFFVEPPEPIPDELVSTYLGVATGFIVAYPVGEAPAEGQYEDPETEMDDFAYKAIGYVNNFGVIYQAENFTSPLLEQLRLDGFESWLDLFDDGYSCARAFVIEDRGADGFEPAECSSMVLSIGIVSEMEIVGPDWF